MVEKLVIQGLAQEVIELREQARATFRETMVEAMALLLEHAMELDALKEQLKSLREELRRYTASQVRH